MEQVTLQGRRLNIGDRWDSQGETLVVDIGPEPRGYLFGLLTAQSMIAALSRELPWWAFVRRAGLHMAWRAVLDLAFRHGQTFEAQKS